MEQIFNLAMAVSHGCFWQYTQAGTACAGPDLPQLTMLMVYSLHGPIWSCWQPAH